MPLDRSSRNRLTRRTAVNFPGDTLFARVARTVCEAECLPRKELFEAWEVARRVRRRFRGQKVVELCAGHGLLAYLLLLLDDSSPEAHCVDIRRPASAGKLARVLEAHWPRLRGRVHYAEAPIEDCAALDGSSLVVSIHACGALSDTVIERAINSQSRLAIMPCCHDIAATDAGYLLGWLRPELAVDVARANRLGHCGYRVHTATIPADITPQNRLLLAQPGSA